MSCCIGLNSDHHATPCQNCAAWHAFAQDLRQGCTGVLALRGAQCQCAIQALALKIVPISLQGLGFPAISNLQTTPAFFNMLNDGSLDQPLFSMYFNPDASKSPAGELGFGVVDATKYVGKLSYAPVTVKK